MEVGLALPAAVSTSRSPALPILAREAEDMGAASLWVNDHLAMVRHPSSPYPYSTDGTIDWDPAAPQLEAMTVLAHVAASTATIRLGTAALILPQRNPIELAKTSATVDVLSGGRLSLGVGAGWHSDEMELLGYSFHDRGFRMEEDIRVLRACWRGDVAPFDGIYTHIPPDVLMYPTPHQVGGPPVLVAGMSRIARNRAVALGDGWLAAVRVDGIGSARLASDLRSIGTRRPAGFRTAVKLNCAGSTDNEIHAAANVARNIGFDELILDIPWSDARRPLRVLESLLRAPAGTLR
ncbi:TIGR03619 family F420-dependent LLM class oxidoreductase [Nocardia altamirensis]|uniref:TIGR03619 family F420-dependent LLM class oxidoreductase n=1 Tax=Nocardia altamirensis TaxID=472158 RepID=UPI0008402903|nr:TIGR03619 family F420-dependent LLM class oxidoreductase [Nocardia altamirensis]